MTFRHCLPRPIKGVIVLNSGDSVTLAHEPGAIPINPKHHTKTGLMSPRPARPANSPRLNKGGIVVFDPISSAAHRSVP